MRRKHRADEYFANSLTARERTEFEGHLSSCAACTRALEELGALQTKLSTEWSHARPLPTPRPEWVHQLRTGFPSQPKTRNRWPALAGVSLAAAVVLIALVVLRPWQAPAPPGSVAPSRSLTSAYEGTLARSFHGTLTVLDGNEVLYAGQFDHATDGRWTSMLRSASGQSIEETQVGGRVWRRQADGPWEPAAVNSPLLSLPHNAGPMDRLPVLLKRLIDLSDVTATGSNQYAGASGITRTMSSGGGAMVWVTDSAANVAVSISDGGTFREVRYAPVNADAGHTVLIKLEFEAYGTSPTITAPSP